MTVFLWILAVLLVLFLLYLKALRGTNGRMTDSMLNTHYAHRGLHNSKAGVPENSMVAFKAALSKGYGAEFDLHLTADKQLAVIHDASLKRTAGEDVNVFDLTADELQNYRLEGTDEKIPMFSEVLELFDGKVPLIIELKTDKGNAAELCEYTLEALKDYKGEYCIESFDPRCILWLKKNKPEIIRGQLSQNFLKDKYKGFFFNLFLTSLVTNAATRPDFVAFNHKHKKALPFLLFTKVWQGQGIAWTIRSSEELQNAADDGYPVIFENLEP